MYVIIYGWQNVSELYVSGFLKIIESNFCFSNVEMCDSDSARSHTHMHTHTHCEGSLVKCATNQKLLWVF